jgi:hypothetical protein
MHIHCLFNILHFKNPARTEKCYYKLYVGENTEHYDPDYNQQRRPLLAVDQ